jgi:flagellar hook assembly protein FlgD
LPESGETRLQVFAADGRLVRTLVSGALAAGPHTLSWNGTDGRGRSMPAGVYCYRLRGAGADLQQKVVRIE